MSKRLDAGDFHLGLMCGARFFSLRDWKLYKLRWTGTGFNIGPVYFWKEKIA